MCKVLNILLVLLTITVILYNTSAASPQSRIIGGQPLEQPENNGVLTHTPYMVSVQYKKNTSTPFDHRCAGIIYANNIVLTTATCVVGLDKKSLLIKAGSSYRSSFDGVFNLVDNYVIHPNYNIWFMDNDLAFLQLAFKFTTLRPKEISPISIANFMPNTGSLSTIFGWGSTKLYNNDYSEIVQFTQVTIVEYNKCKLAYGEERVTRSMFCAGAVGRGFCLGDAGGPLVYEGNAVGLMSWGWGCGNADFPGVYTNLVELRSWIEEESKKMMIEKQAEKIRLKEDLKKMRTEEEANKI